MTASIDNWSSSFSVSIIETKSFYIREMEAAQPFVCGGMSAILASSVVHPIDLAKVRLQLFKLQHPTAKPPSFPVIISTMIKNEGIKSIYSGFSAAFMRQCVYGTARIGLHRSFSDYLVKNNDGKPLSFGTKALRYFYVYVRWN